MQKNKKGFSIMMALGLVIFINLIAVGILEYIVPFARETKNIENSVVSYYQADSGIEEALFYLSDENYELGTESGITLNATNPVASSFNITASGSILPKPGYGDSEYDSDWNQVAIGNPIQLQIGYGKVNFGNVGFGFRIPDLKNGADLTLSGSDIDLPIINWQLSSENNTLNANDSHIVPNDICKLSIDFDICKLDLYGEQGIDLNGDEGSNQEIGKFHDDNCGSGSGCILKLSVINKLKTDDLINPISIPYLEWKIDFGSETPPLRYSIIETEGKAYGYKKSLQIRVPQQTTNEAFDFTVFQ